MAKWWAVELVKKKWCLWWCFRAFRVAFLTCRKLWFACWLRLWLQSRVGDGCCHFSKSKNASSLLVLVGVITRVRLRVERLRSTSL